METVLVTGANGHLGYALVRELTEAGYAVRAGVRDPDDAQRTERLRALNAQVVAADLLAPATLGAALDGVDGLFQVAAVYNTTARDPDRDVKQPTIQGSRNILEAAHDAGVRRIVYTSSVAAVGTVKPGQAPRDASHWNDTAVEPYTQAKTESEQHAWRFAETHDLNLVTVLPGTIIGPYLYRHTPSTLMFELLRRGKVPVVLPMTFSLVDVRDVATAHRLAFETEGAHGRYIATGPSVTVREIFDTLRPMATQWKIPTLGLPRAMLGCVPMFDWLGNRLTGAPRFATRKLIREYGYRIQLYDASRTEADLGWKARPLEESLRDSVSWIEEHDVSLP